MRPFFSTGDIMKKMLLGLGLLLGSYAGLAQADTSKPLNIVVPYAAGGPSDSIIRSIGKVIEKDTSQNVIIENRPGGNTVIGAQALLNKADDDNSVLLIAASFVITPSLMQKLPYDINKDFRQITRLASNPHVLVVSNDVPVSNLTEFIEWAKKEDNKGTYSSFGTGSSGHLGYELFNHQVGLDLLHVPYKGAAPATLAVLSSEVHSTLGDVGAIAPHLEAGKLKALAVSGTERHPRMPDVPTFAEQGYPDFTSETWLGLLAKSSVSDERIEQLNRLFTTALAHPDVQAILEQQGMQAKPTDAAGFADFMTKEALKYKQVINDANVRIE